MRRCVRVLTGLFVFSALAFRPCAVQAEDTLKSLPDPFEQAREMFWAGDPAGAVRVLRDTALSAENIGSFRMVRAAGLLCDVLRFTRSSSVFRQFDRDLKIIEAELKEVREEGAIMPAARNSLLAYIKETRKFLGWFPKKGKSPEAFQPLNLDRAIKMAEYSAAIGREDPIRRVKLDEALLHWVRTAMPDHAADRAEAEKMEKLKHLVEVSHAYLESSFWFRGAADNARTPDPGILSAVLVKLSEAVAKKDPDTVRMLFYPGSAFAEPFLSLILNGRVIFLEYSDFGALRPSWDRKELVMPCRSKSLVREGDKIREVKSPEAVVFKKYGEDWRIERL
ncbi:MAG: hypothetical protein A2Z83_06780 [Omnitrophica bacterium GWA2_52_8]|nr:MAG: hypothetical protein A2Z83_06780 [Omnitrophica bacterium GWA2_52_8]